MPITRIALLAMVMATSCPFCIYRGLELFKYRQDHMRDGGMVALPLTIPDTLLQDLTYCGFQGASQFFIIFSVKTSQYGFEVLH